MTRAMFVPWTTQGVCESGPCTLPESVPPGAGAVKDTVGAPPGVVGAGWVGDGEETPFWICTWRVAVVDWPAAL
jgi:hypothetical protein